MKLAFIALATLTSLSAFAEGPILNCKATRDGPRADGRPGYERIDEKTFTTVISSKIKKTQLIGAELITFVNAKGDYVLNINDHDLSASSSSVGTLANKNINLSLDGKGITNYVTCEVQ